MLITPYELADRDLKIIQYIMPSNIVGTDMARRVSYTIKEFINESRKALITQYAPILGAAMGSLPADVDTLVDLIFSDANPGYKDCDTRNDEAAKAKAAEVAAKAIADQIAADEEAAAQAAAQIAADEAAALKAAADAEAFKAAVAAEVQAQLAAQQAIPDQPAQ